MYRDISMYRDLLRNTKIDAYATTNIQNSTKTHIFEPFVQNVKSLINRFRKYK